MIRYYKQVIVAPGIEYKVTYIKTDRELFIGRMGCTFRRHDGTKSYGYQFLSSKAEYDMASNDMRRETYCNTARQCGGWDKHGNRW